MSIINFMKKVHELGGSDLHMAVGLPMMIRVHGRLEPMDNEIITSEKAKEYVYSIIDKEHSQELENKGQSDFAATIEGGLRFRCNAYREREKYAICMRLIKDNIPSLDKLGLPKTVEDLSKLARGLVLITGPTGSGKSTTLASLIDQINQNQDAHILTLEDPIEYVHKHKKSIIHQREIGTDTSSYTDALRAALRQDPDIILVGEMRDLDTIEIALTAAETGHLVFSTLHTIGGAKTIDRVIDVFPPHQQSQVRVQLSTTLQAVVSQQLVPNATGNGRVCICEVMTCTPALRNLIREGKTPQINNVIATSKMQGMQLMDNALSDAVVQRKITAQEAVNWAVDPEVFAQKFNIKY